jgi:hypothetical protein
MALLQQTLPRTIPFPENIEPDCAQEDGQQGSRGSVSPLSSELGCKAFGEHRRVRNDIMGVCRGKEVKNLARGQSNKLHHP